MLTWTPALAAAETVTDAIRVPNYLAAASGVCVTSSCWYMVPMDARASGIKVSSDGAVYKLARKGGQGGNICM